MAWSVLADLVVVVHFGFILFVALGGLLSWPWPQLAWAHLPAVAWAAGIVTVGYDCPLTPLERHLRRLGGEQGYAGGFVDRYIEGVIYPDRYTPLVRGVVAAAVLVGWAGVALRSHQRSQLAPRTAVGRAP
ncbi:MAG: DUF2784 domain-containing protein [Acidimicrobiales bacterium]